MGVRITDKTGEIFSDSSLNGYASQILEILGKAEWELSVVICDDVFIAELNKRYLDRDGATNVISFSQVEPQAVAALSEPLLGDVVISLDTARREALEIERPLEEYLVELLLHGVLHLIGYDHELGPDAEAAMEEARCMVLDALTKKESD